MAKEENVTDEEKEKRQMLLEWKKKWIAGAAKSKPNYSSKFQPKYSFKFQPNYSSNSKLNYSSNSKPNYSSNSKPSSNYKRRCSPHVRLKQQDPEKYQRFLENKRAYKRAYWARISAAEHMAKMNDLTIEEQEKIDKLLERKRRMNAEAARRMREMRERKKVEAQILPEKHARDLEKRRAKYKLKKERQRLLQCYGNVDFFTKLIPEDMSTKPTNKP